MQPLVRILVRNGVSYQEFAELLKSVFVEVAERDFTIAGRKSSQSRIAILTGLSRKEVSRQKAILAGGGPIDATSNLNGITRLLVGWHSDPEYTGPYGMPIEVPFESAGGPSFTQLVKRHSGDMAPRAVLDELMRVGAVDELGNGLLRVLTLAYIPQRLNPDALERFGEVVRNFICTYEYNMERPPSASGAGRFERIVFPDDGLRPSLMPAFEKLIRTKGQQLLVELLNWLNAQEISQDAKPSDSTRINTGVGIYHFIDDGSE